MCPIVLCVANSNRHIQAWPTMFSYLLHFVEWSGQLMTSNLGLKFTIHSSLSGILCRWVKLTLFGLKKSTLAHRSKTPVFWHMGKRNLLRSNNFYVYMCITVRISANLNYFLYFVSSLNYLWTFCWLLLKCLANGPMFLKSAHLWHSNRALITTSGIGSSMNASLELTIHQQSSP